MRHPRVPTGPTHSGCATRQVYSQSSVASASLPRRNTTRRFGTPAVHNAASTATPVGPSSFQGAASPSLSQRNNMYEGAVHNAVCDLCDSGIRGYRYVRVLSFRSGITETTDFQKCLVCPDFDTCANCFR